MGEIIKYLNPVDAMMATVLCCGSNRLKARCYQFVSCRLDV